MGSIEGRGMTTMITQSDNLATMAAELEQLLADYQRREGDWHPGAFDREYFQRKGVMTGMIIAHVERRGGRASDRFDAARIAFAGVKVSCTSGMIQCARNWCRKARASMGAAA